jgi:HEAT repeats
LAAIVIQFRMNRSRWFFAVAMVLVVIAASTLLVVALNRVLGRHSQLVDGKSIDEWREILRQDGLTGSVSKQLAEQFVLRSASASVLLTCAGDADPNVRWVAVHLLGLSGTPEQSVPVAVRLLHDPNAEVRFHAVKALGLLGADARSASAELQAAFHDPDDRVSWAAECALWTVDLNSALSQGHWQKFDSPEFNFSASFPGMPERSETDAALTFGASYGGSRFAVAVSELPADAIQTDSSDELFDRGRDATIAGLGGKLVSEAQYHQSGFPGREYIVDVPAKGTTHKRVLLDGRRLYQVLVAYPTQSEIPEAVQYFFDSFQLHDSQQQ